MKLKTDALNDLDPEALQKLALHLQTLQSNPLERFHACPSYCGPGCQLPTERNPKGGRPKQHAFMAANEWVVATNAGNRFGKTTAMVVKTIVQHTPTEHLPERLREFKQAKSQVVKGRYMMPSEDMLEDTILPVFKEWMPEQLLLDESWAKAYNKAHNTITFKDGGKLGFYTYKQDPSVLAGATLDYIMWDEPPPEPHWRESLIRVMDRQGFHRFGMTPVNMQGGGIGWIKKKLFDRANPQKPGYDPKYRAISASVWDNPQYSDDEVEHVLSQYPEDERQAREFGTFLHFGGMIYPVGFEHILRDPLTPDKLKGNDIVVGVDPGVKNAAFVWVSFDSDNVAVVFDEVLIQEGTVLDYARQIRSTNLKWGLTEAPLYVIDPSARNRNSINLENIEGELARQGIFCIHGYNPVEAGCQSIRRRIGEGGLFVARNCGLIRGEAEEYRMEDNPDGEFKPVKENDHELDALRYACMSRPWYPIQDQSYPDYHWEPGTAIPFEVMNADRDGAPLI